MGRPPWSWRGEAGGASGAAQPLSLWRPPPGRCQVLGEAPSLEPRALGQGPGSGAPVLAQLAVCQAGPTTWGGRRSLQCGVHGSKGPGVQLACPVLARPAAAWPATGAQGRVGSRPHGALCVVTQGGSLPLCLVCVTSQEPGGTDVLCPARRPLRPWGSSWASAGMKGRVPQEVRLAASAAKGWLAPSGLWPSVAPGVSGPGLLGALVKQGLGVVSTPQPPARADLPGPSWGFDAQSLRPGGAGPS